MGRVIKETSPFDNTRTAETKTYYDANSNVISYELKNNGTTQNMTEYTYNNVNRMTSLANNGITTSYTYDANGNVTEKALSNGVTTTYTYNNAGLMTYTETRKGENVYTYSNCEYMLNGLLTNVEMPGTEKAYAYDGIGRLAGETVTNGTTVSVSDVYSYDLRGNRTSKTGIGTVTQYTYDLNNRLLSSTEETADTSIIMQYYYDKNGNTISKVTTEIAPSTGDAQYTISDTANSYVTFYDYNSYNRLTRAETDGVVSEYTYNADNLRVKKTVGNITTEYVWDGQNLAAETKQGTTDTYTYDMTGVHTRKRRNAVTSYLKDYHGNVIGIAGSTGRLDYDAYGNQIQGGTPDPFGYCGEYQDLCSGLIYLRNRYYDTSTGRFISEDPAKNGLNWYVYCKNNPITFIDPLGLFDYNDKLSYNQTYNRDVEALQSRLVELGYMNAPANGDWGYFGSKTQNAVNSYKNDMGLWNFGTYKGVVGLTTWESLGLIYRTQADINAGVEIFMTCGRKQYKDVSVPISNALSNAEGTFANHSGEFKWFKNQVNHGADWDIKRKAPWEKTIGSTFPGSYNTPVVLFGYFTTPEELGNITYGYLGTAAGFGEITLIAGSVYAAGMWNIITDKDARTNEFNDHNAIRTGINWYNDR